MTKAPGVARGLDVSPMARAILDGSRGELQPPIRSEVFGMQRFAEHGRSLGQAHRACRARARDAAFFPRLRDNIRVLREANRYLGMQAAGGDEVSPAAEWLLDNFHLMDAQFHAVREDLPRSYFRSLPVLADEPLAGLPRVYGIAWAFVAHTDSAFDEELLVSFLCAYQQTRELTLREMWALPTTLRVVLIENLRRLAERVAAQKAAREVADLCCDRIEASSLLWLQDLHARLHARGVGTAFLAQMGLRLHEQAVDPIARPASVAAWLRHALPDPAVVQGQAHADQTCDNLSVSNAVAALRAIGDADWSCIVARASALMGMMLQSAAFEAEHTLTRDRTLHDIEALSRRSARSEMEVTRQLLASMRGPPPSPQDAAAAGTASYWLRGGGRAALDRALGMPGWTAPAWTGAVRGLLLPAYLGAMAGGTFALVAWMPMAFGMAQAPAAAWLSGLCALLLAFPASEAVMAVINRLVGESAPPSHLPRLALADGIPAGQRVMVVIPALLTDALTISQLARRLHLHYLANPEEHAQFALLTDWTDARTAQTPFDQALLDEAVRHVGRLNDLHAPIEGRPPRFLLLHRGRRFSHSEQAWIGWDRKRGKLEQLLAALAEGHCDAFADLGELSRMSEGTAFVVTLDSDTQLPPGRLRELVGVAAHPCNRPRLDPAGRAVAHGYAILQPRIVTPLPAAADFTPFHWLSSGQCGTDPYGAATSEIYQDLFGEGSFTGKGLIDVQVAHTLLSGRLPEDCVLSHDLIEGCIARCASVADIEVIEEAPFHADVAAARQHRWMRGDWQLLPFLFSRPGGPLRLRLRALDRWKMADNLRRSLVAPASVCGLLLALAGVGVSPWAALALVAAAFSAGPLMSAAAGFAPGRDDLAARHFYRGALVELARVACNTLWLTGQLMQQALLAGDAIGRAAWRLAVSRRHLLQWTTAAASRAAARRRLADVACPRWRTSLLSALALGGLLAAGTQAPALAVGLCLLWAASPVAAWWVSRPLAPSRTAALPPQERAYLEGVARDTWRLFERCVGPEDHHLPPDNLQVSPHDIVAHRTSPTNIGLYLLSVACAREFGWIGTQELLARLEATCSTLLSMQRHRGHFLNWYDTRTLAPLPPAYVSTVDSGNLSAHLLATAMACRERGCAPHDGAALRAALRASRTRIETRRAGRHAADAGLAWGSAWIALMSLPDDLGKCRGRQPQVERMLQEAADELAGLPPQVQSGELSWLLGDHLATLRSAWLEVDADPGAQPDAHRRLCLLAERFEQLAWEADFGMLYHRRRHLFHIGLRVAEQELDDGFYDLLASESRLASLLAIAKGDVPVAHWKALGRPFHAAGATAGLRSWSGSMFEYLMPTLVLDEPAGSLLHDACRAALSEQLRFAAAAGVPWGISESAYAGCDQTLAYQYAPQGVPTLALRRTPPGELVVAPYASALAAQIAPVLAARNLGRLEKLSARRRYGFIEALDFSPARRTGAAGSAVATFMAHHQGMTIVALADVLLGAPARRWAMHNTALEAVASLLHERPPREATALPMPPYGPPAQPLKQRDGGFVREVIPGMAAVEPTHLLSNGRYNVSLRANGAGTSRWGAVGLSRWRDDALRDARGSFVYLRRGGARPVSVTQHPAPDPDADYRSTFHADRVCFDASWADFHVRTTVWISPEDDVEFRRVELGNLGPRQIEVEVISAFEPTLSDARADEAHPAFSNLFVTARWDPAGQALVITRRPRLPQDPQLQAAHFLTDTDAQVLQVRAQADRQHWAGRNRGPSQPLAELFDLPAACDAERGEHTLDTGLDPACVLAARVRIAAGAKVQLTFATAASDDPAVLRALLDKYRQASHVQRASLMSATLTGIRLHGLRMGAEDFAAVQSLTTALVLNLPRRIAPQATADGDASATTDRRLLWRVGISGDHPIILVSAAAPQGLGLLRSLAQALRLWSWGDIACDVVVVNAEPASYLMPLHREIVALQARHLADGPRSKAAAAGFHLFRVDQLAPEELSTLHGLARVRLHADGRPLLHHIRAWMRWHEEDQEERGGTGTTVLAHASSSGTVRVAGGAFSTAGEFRFDVGAHVRPARPWINVLANPAFGAQISEAGAGHTWAVNSRLNQLTPWSNDPVCDPPGEWMLLQDCRTREAWQLTPSDCGDPGATYHVAHGQGWSSITHRRGKLDVDVCWCVDAEASVKQVRVRLVNRGHRPLQLRLAGVAEWIMGAGRADRSTVHTAMRCIRLPVPAMAAHEGQDARLPFHALLCTQREQSLGWGWGTAFLAIGSAAGDVLDWTCDRRECFDSRGRQVLPDHFGQRCGAGLDPCAALSLRFEVEAGHAAERVFLMGYAPSPDAAWELAQRAAVVPAQRRLDEVRRGWDRLLQASVVHTPDPLFDVMVNRWLLYQTVSCRLWSKAGFYQAGGATGFRDQLQDAMALSWAEPGLLRRQIVLCASRQFAQGDVQHWWHAPQGAGVRTHISDDLLWLPHACVRYLLATGDMALLDEAVPFIEGDEIPAGAEDAYYVPRVSTQTASVYEHAALTIDRSLRVGVHGLPLMGSGDWNDGMNRVGAQGRGESVWLGWFLCHLVRDFAPLARSRGEAERAGQWEAAAAGWKSALNTTAWDGEWFKRAFFDDGQALGTRTAAEGRIDLIAQAWSVLSGAAPAELQEQALAAVRRHLVDEEAGLVRLLHPPFAQARPSPGYVQAYPAGVRENGGQYAHAGVWALMAQAQAAVHGPSTQADGMDGADLAYRWFTYLSPAHRASHPAWGAAYGLEPYVVAGDVHAGAHAGRGGWSWYTGAAGWLHRAAVESILGLRQGAETLSFQPCLPPHWDRAELTLRRDGRAMRFILLRADTQQARRAAGSLDAALLHPGQPLRWHGLADGSTFVVPLPLAAAQAQPAGPDMTVAVQP